MPSHDELDLLLADMERVLAERQGRDAIDAALHSAPRENAATSIRDHEIVRRFREEMTDGLIRLDTAHQLLAFLRSVLGVAGKS